MGWECHRVGPQSPGEARSPGTRPSPGEGPLGSMAPQLFVPVEAGRRRWGQKASLLVPRAREPPAL